MGLQCGMKYICFYTYSEETRKREIILKIISVFNNKGGVGKTTLTYHLSHSLSEMGFKVLMIDLDPQCNLTICGVSDEELLNIWEKEDPFIDDFESSKVNIGEQEFNKLNNQPRSIHYLLKPTEDGTGDLKELPPPIKIDPNLFLIPGRLSMHKYENSIAERWNGLYSGVPLSIRTVTKIRNLAEEYGKELKCDFVIIDTSPSLGILNKIIISTVDGFFIPCLPDMFSLYGVRNIGDYLSIWKKEFDAIYGLISTEKRKNFPENFVRFLGFTIYNAKRYKNPDPEHFNLAQAHYNYVIKIPEFIEKFIKFEVRNHLTNEMIHNPIGGMSVMHTHNTFPNMAQKYKNPIWKVPDLTTLESEDAPTIHGNSPYYRALKIKYQDFANSLLDRIKTLDL
ncbi:MAG: cellulose biosynthesis protein BcsQ [Clostridium sp.]